MRKKVITANWKMNMTVAETESFLTSFRLEIEEVSGVEIVIAPPFTALPKLSELLGGSQRIRLGAQNFYHEKPGAYTGEISAGMLRELFVRYVIIGHSERRQIFGESDELINKKVLAAVASELRPILCIGETLQEREAGKEKTILEGQLKADLQGVAAEDLTLLEYDPKLAKLLCARFPDVRVVSACATKLDSLELYGEKSVGAIVSGLPLLSMPHGVIQRILEAAFSQLSENGAIYQFTYRPLCPVPRKVMKALDLQGVCTSFSLRNLPPAWVFAIRKRSARF